MYYIISVVITFLQTLLVNWMMGLPVFDIAPYTIRLWCNYLAASMVLWSPMLFTNKWRWTYLVAILLDVWFIGNLVYFRSYGDVLNHWCLQNASNMNGIWSSILPFLHWKDISFVCFTLLWILISETIHRDFFLTLWKRIGIAFVAFLIFCTPQTLIHKKAELPISPFSTYYADLSMGRMWYIHCFGAITHFANETINHTCRTETPAAPVSAEEIEPFLQDMPTRSLEDSSNLLFVFFESLEYWTIGLCIGENEITPNLNSLILNPHAACYPMQAQVKEGKSSDAQLIILNGLLPIYNGAVSMRYSSNEFPSIVKESKARSKKTFAANNPNTWNKIPMAAAYGFDTLIAEDMSDFKLAKKVMTNIMPLQRPFVHLVTTMASHAPFTMYADSVSLPIDAQYTKEQQNYLRCVHYTDSAVGGIIDAIMEDSVLAANTRIVIVGDHPIFDLETPVPFIIYDPFSPPVTVTRTLYQIDIYTTLVDRMRIKTRWRGLGKNIADTCAYSSEEMRALESLSDRLIRTNYFKK